VASAGDVLALSRFDTDTRNMTVEMFDTLPDLTREVTIHETNLAAANQAKADASEKKKSAADGRKALMKRLQDLIGGAAGASAPKAKRRRR
jgi:hypothetical protein